MLAVYNGGVRDYDMIDLKSEESVICYNKSIKKTGLLSDTKIHNEINRNLHEFGTNWKNNLIEMLNNNNE